MVLLSPVARGPVLSPAIRDHRIESTIALVTDDIYSVMTDLETLGFVHKVGNVYVALSGDVLSHAVEIGQSLSWDRAVHMVRFP
ncbi:MAG: hypothetical protein JWQ39_66 [Glaciihabitans sp.]|jgi:hypothetical protein|nr:hypothetical protein [Glaciihabitans sp.]